VTADPTLAVYRQRAAEWAEQRTPVGGAAEWASSLAATERPVVDLGCGPGWHLADLGRPTIALDATEAFLAMAPRYAPEARRVCADLRALPFRRGSIGAAWGSKSLVHLARSEVPLALWDLHRSLRVDAPVRLTFFEGDLEHGESPDDDFAGRRFSLWPRELLAHVLAGAGFLDARIGEVETGDGTTLVVTARRSRTLADSVGPGMRLLVVGLNPSWYAADAGVGFARPGNRFWPAALDAGIVSIDRDPWHALRTHGVGMTDLVKRPSARADELDRSEYRDGRARLAALVELLGPAATCIVGLSGWRSAVDRRATPGVQTERFAGRPVYVMPNTSGVNARVSLDALADHLRAAARLADGAGG
jgi:TDG/mug DNA glycosylase family protein